MLLMFNILVVIVIFVSLGMSLWRSVKGPTLVDRAAGMDVATSSIAAVFAIMSIFNPQSGRVFLDIVLLAIGIGFVTAIFLAKAQQKTRSGVAP